MSRRPTITAIVLGLVVAAAAGASCSSRPDRHFVDTTPDAGGGDAIPSSDGAGGAGGRDTGSGEAQAGTTGADSSVGGSVSVEAGADVRAEAEAATEAGRGEAAAPDAEAGREAGPDAQPDGDAGSMCVPLDGTCVYNDDCCGYPATATCSDYGSGFTCTPYCTRNSDCATGCCGVLTTGVGTCAPPSWCGSPCFPLSSLGGDDVGYVCDVDSDCCSPDGGPSAKCVDPDMSNVPQRCATTCAADADCGSQCCVDLGNYGGKVCFPSEFCGYSCLGWCASSGDGFCDDGGPGSVQSACTLGTDCQDCGVRNAGTNICENTCGPTFSGPDPGVWAADGFCDDGGTGSDFDVCPYGTDCSDCGPRAGCVDTCATASNTVCEDGGSGSAAATCDLGTDCADCGARTL